MANPDFTLSLVETGATLLVTMPTTGTGGLSLDVTLFSDLEKSTVSETINVSVPGPAALILTGFGVLTMGLSRRLRRGRQA